MQPLHVPAWKRLGLKLKVATSDADPHPVAGRAGKARKRGMDEGKAPSEALTPVSHVAKRQRVSAASTAEIRSNSIKPHTEDATQLGAPKQGRKKVSFSTEDLTGSPVEVSSKTKLDGPKERSGKQGKGKDTLPKLEKSRSALEYLDQFHNARQTWKFNKNREVWILKHIHSTSDIPLPYNIALATYVHGLRSESARSRLIDQCREAIALERVAGSGDLVLEDGLSNSHSQKEDVETRDAYHAAAIQRFRRSLEGKPRPENEKEDASEDEERYQTWLRDRKRAELLLWSLSGSAPEEAQLAVDTEKPPQWRASPAAAGFVSSSSAAAATTNATTNTMANRMQKKKRKNRTAVVEISTSSDSSDGESDASDARPRRPSTESSQPQAPSIEHEGGSGSTSTAGSSDEG